MKVEPSILLMAKIADNTALNVYAKTKDALTGCNYPKSIVRSLTEIAEDFEKPREYENGEDFLKEWDRLCHKAQI